MSTLMTRIDGHTVTAVRVVSPRGALWEVQIDAQLPVMEREFELRSTYCAASPSTAMGAAMCDLFDFINWG